VNRELGGWEQDRDVKMIYEPQKTFFPRYSIINKSKTLNDESDKTLPGTDHPKGEGKKDWVLKSRDWEYCFENPDGKKR
jgi:hypothetical protein